MNRLRLLLIACAASLAALTLGTAAVLTRDEPAPNWLMSAGLALLLASSLAYGFLGALPRLAPVLWSRPLRGSALVILGVAAVFVPAPFAIAAVLIAVGTRLIWASACELDDRERHDLEATVFSSPVTITPVPPRRGMARTDYQERH